VKKTELIFNLISIPTDILSLLAAGIVSFYLRYQTDSVVGPVMFDLSLNAFLLILIKVIPIVLIIFAWLGLYAQTGTRRFLYELKSVTLGISVAAFLTIILFFFNQTIFPSRFIILSAWILSIIFVICSRLILKLIQGEMFRKGFGLHKLVLIDGDKTESTIIKSVLSNHKFGYKIVSELNNDEKLFDHLIDLFAKQKVDEIVQTNNSVDSETNLKLVEFARLHGVQFSFVPNLFEVQRNVIELNNLKGIPVISLKNTPLDGWGKAYKRILDIVVSSLCLLITSPVLLILAIAIKLDSKGPVFYKATRCGRDKDFECYKLRSMYAHLSVGDKYGKEEAKKILEELIETSAENRSGPLWKIKDDPRVTKVGKFLRRTKLDEIPQFWNVLRGDMSMVGPRPHVPEQVEQYKNTNGRVLSIKPGIFGFTQIAQSNWPTLPFEEEIRLDTYYIENWSIWMDLGILIKSFLLLFWDKKSTDDY
jgi:exopolysaccharide biosynthesis polyprenyl glycosylphosphotransferase